MLALWGRLWSRLSFRFWHGLRLPIPWDKTVISNIFGEVKLALKDMAKAPNPMACFGPHNLVVNMVWHATIRGTGVATPAMAENHTQTDSIGLQLQVECWYEQEELPKHDPAPLSLYN